MMFSRRITIRTLEAGAFAATVLLCAGAGHGAAKAGHGESKRSKDKHACKVAFKSAQAREQAGKLREAKQLLLTCANASCGGVLKKECTARYTHLDAEIPSVVPLVTDDARTDVQVKMDGELLTSRLDGRALSVDPGMHQFTFSTEKGVVAAQTLMIQRGQQGRSISVALHGSDSRAPIETPATIASEPKAALTGPAASATEAPGEASASPIASSGPPTLAYVLGGVGVVGVGTGVLLNVWGRKDNRDLLASCAPNCQQSSVDHARKIYFAADVSIGVGVAALGVATVLFLLPHHAKEKPETRAAYTIDLQPTPAGAFATVSGAF
jgi:hypothetical protein